VTVALVAAAASLGALAIVLLALLTRRRSSPSRDERLALALGSRELGASIDLDEVLARTLEAATAIAGADAALVSITGVDGEPLVVARGLTAEEAEREATVGPSRGPRAGSAAVQLAGEEGPIGVLTVLCRTPGRSFGADAVAELERLAARAGPAIDNARRFREARQLADLDALTGLHNRRYFHETLEREIARARRYDRHLSLIVLDLDDFKEVNDRIGHLAGDSVLAAAAERVREVVRSADVPCRVGGDEFAVILPESTLADGDQLYRRIQAAVAARPIAQVSQLHLSAGVAELRAEDDAASFFQRADKALYRAKGSGKGQVVAAG
jgi:diguanylate cyclase (GGDEF)-like protein